MSHPQHIPPFADTLRSSGERRFADVIQDACVHYADSTDKPEGRWAAKAPAQVQSIPTIHIRRKYWSHDPLQPSRNVHAWLSSELSVKRLDDIFDALWWAGRQVPPRALHHLEMLRYRLTVTERADLYLVRNTSEVFLKPLPDWLMCRNFWIEHIYTDEVLHRNARGFLFSYVWLVQRRSDFKISQERWLLPSELTWADWSIFVDSTWQKGDPDDLSTVSIRYHYGELRLSRLNQIYRFTPRFHLKYLRRGYLYTYKSYSAFLKRKFAWLVLAFAYLTIILSAVQVGLATPQLSGHVAFLKVSYGFAVAAIVLPLAAAILAILLYISLWLYHVSTTWVAWRKGAKKEAHDAMETVNDS